MMNSLRLRHPPQRESFALCARGKERLKGRGAALHRSTRRRFNSDLTLTFMRQSSRLVSLCITRRRACEARAVMPNLVRQFDGGLPRDHRPSRESQVRVSTFGLRKAALLYATCASNNRGLQCLYTRGRAKVYYAQMSHERSLVIIREELDAIAKISGKQTGNGILHK